jgi:hypothetical protein
MAPKKKPGKKEDGLSDKELLQKAEAELLSLRRLLELKTFEVLLCRLLQYCCVLQLSLLACQIISMQSQHRAMQMAVIHIHVGHLPCTALQQAA